MGDFLVVLPLEPSHIRTFRLSGFWSQPPAWIRQACHALRLFGFFMAPKKEDHLAFPGPNCATEMWIGVCCLSKPSGQLGSEIKILMPDGSGFLEVRFPWPTITSAFSD